MPPCIYLYLEPSSETGIARRNPYPRAPRARRLGELAEKLSDLVCSCGVEPAGILVVARTVTQGRASGSMRKLPKPETLNPKTLDPKHPSTIYPLGSSPDARSRNPKAQVADASRLLPGS